MPTTTGASISDDANHQADREGSPMASAEALRLVRELIRSYRSDESMSLADQRASMDAAPQPLPDGVRLAEVAEEVLGWHKPTGLGGR